MKITDERNKFKMEFEDLKVGDIFVDYDGDFCMKIDPCDGVYDDFNVVILKNGLLFHYDDWDFVTKVNAELILK